MSMPHLGELHRRLADQGLVCIGVHTEKKGEQMAAYVEEEGIPFPVAVDSEGKTVEAYRVDSYPDYYLIDRAGKLRVADLANADLDRALEILLAEKPPADAVAARGRPSSRKVRPIVFAEVDRSIRGLPRARTGPLLYGLFLFGPGGETKVWALLDKSSAGVPGYDVLWLDVDADGVLGEKGERFAGKAGTFKVGDFKEHRDFTLRWTEKSVRYSMLWRGEKPTRGGYGPERATYARFATSPEEAPIFVPGYDRPFEFEHWMSGQLRAGQDNDFKVFVGNRGDRRGAFSAVDDKFLPAGEYVVATLLFTTRSGKKARVMTKLRERC
ncbi:MAG: peroxiredoxin family protein [Planctomycetota bacterium]